MMIRRLLFFAITLPVFVTTGCGPKKGDVVRGLTDIPGDAKVVLTTRQGLIGELPEALRSRFVRMVQQDAVYVDISRAGGRLAGQFVIGKEVFYWHGNGVIYGGAHKGRAWTSPFLQALVNRSFGSRSRIETVADWKALLTELATSPDIDTTPVDKVLAYPRS